MIKVSKIPWRCCILMSAGLPCSESYQSSHVSHWAAFHCSFCERKTPPTCNALAVDSQTPDLDRFSGWTERNSRKTQFSFRSWIAHCGDLTVSVSGVILTRQSVPRCDSSTFSARAQKHACHTRHGSSWLQQWSEQGSDTCKITEEREKKQKSKQASPATINRLL